CQAGPESQPPRHLGLCLTSGGDETVVGVDLGTASIGAISDRLVRPSPLYPDVAAGTIVGSSTFATS
ncbi:MAG TPA: hypothetical protein VKV35_09260, partial [Streptosporangiaceae bacterium]|nr:hypothetical protein [Streptosporangiaceae bacterium]